ncbi:histidine phosphatase family protein [Streptomyces sp. NPDC044571]|uniref:histidine phosphatase family protein n=1 Tax=Streptomyces sp. NPDC044571 TaxID=3155371 RepID=UPI0034000A0F
MGELGIAVEDVFLVRHGESEGNAAYREPDSAYARRVFTRPQWEWRLTPKGEEQAAATGAWLRDRIPAGPPACAVSPLTRAVETAALLDLPGSAWQLDLGLREREWGEWDHLTPERQRAELARGEEHPVHWGPPGGESLSDVIHRVRVPLAALLAEPARAAVAVSHADTLQALAFLLAGHTPGTWTEYYRHTGPVANAGVLHFTRRHPDTGALSPHFAWFRTPPGPFRPCPANPRATSAELLAEARRVPRIPRETVPRPVS